VHDHQVGEAPSSAELPVGLHASEQRGLGEQPPGFVVDDKPLAAVGVSQGRFYPGGGAGHDETYEGVRTRDSG
jgi:hypothetical protein